MRLFCFLLLAAARFAFAEDAAEIKQRIERLNVLGSALMIAAHPDDEQTAVLAYLSKGLKVRTAYLSDTRGEGGQNLIGPEQGALLGVIRTQELLAARRIDGAEQYFSRAIDFGYTKTLDEALTRWGRERILGDVVRLIRAYRPDVVILRFSGTSRDGHGQHQASAVLGREAFQAAADPSRFPELGAPWKARRLVRISSRFDRERGAEVDEPAAFVAPIGDYNPLLGKSYTEVAGASRSQHQSQAMGSAQNRGQARLSFALLEGEPGSGSLFSGIDTTWDRVAGGAAAGEVLSRAARDFSAGDPALSVPALLKARAIIGKLDHPWARFKLAELDETIAMCSGIRADFLAARSDATPGSRVGVTFSVINRSGVNWTLTRASAGALNSGESVSLPNNQLVNKSVDWQVPQDHPLTQPFWLRNPTEADVYDIQDKDKLNQADVDPALTAEFELSGSEGTILLRRPLQYRFVDPVRGEVIRPFAVVPPVSVNVSEPVLIFSSAEPRNITVQVTSHSESPSGEVRLKTNGGWRVEPPSASFTLNGNGSARDLTFQVTPPGSTSSTTIQVEATVAGRVNSHSLQLIAYPHIPAQVVLLPAAARAERIELRNLSRRVGYVEGAGDLVPEALRQIGCDVTFLSADDLARGNLSQFDAIVTGVRAYLVRADLRANQQRLLEYVKQGGTLVVQYNVAFGGPGNRNRRLLENLGPFPLEIGSRRVSVETAPVQFPDPSHPLLNKPNKITQSDFQGWVQELGLYFAEKWAPEYQPVLISSDPGEPPSGGGMLYARYGKGIYIYTGYSWFRQLPAGVPGAFRIFANMLSASRVTP